MTATIHQLYFAFYNITTNSTCECSSYDMDFRIHVQSKIKQIKIVCIVRGCFCYETNCLGA